MLVYPYELYRVSKDKIESIFYSINDSILQITNRQKININNIVIAKIDSITGQSETID